MHIKLHTDGKIFPYSCEFGKAFKDEKGLNIHKIVVHNETTLDKGEYVCDVCERPIANIYHLKRHQLTHTGERPFPCDVYGRAFAVNGNLTVQKKINSETKKEITL